MEDVLTQLKKEMMSPQNRKLAQPPEGVHLLPSYLYQFHYSTSTLFMK